MEASDSDLAFNMEQAENIAPSGNVLPLKRDGNAVTGGTHAGMILKALLTSVSEIDRGSEGDGYNCEQFVNLFEPSKCGTLLPGLTVKQQRAMILNTLKTACFNNRSQIKRFFERLRSILERILQDDAYIIDSSADEDGQADREIGPEDQAQVTLCLQSLKYAAFCCQAVLDGRVSQQQERQELKQQSQKLLQSISQNQLSLRMIPQVYEVASDLHEILFSLQGCYLPEAVQARTAIVALCEGWWIANAENKELLIAQCLPLLVLDATEDANFSKSHIRRLYKLREAFLCIDYSNPSSESLRRSLLQVASNPLCLKLPEGKKFLACLFHDVDLIKDLHLAFRAQIPQAKKSILQAYGEIYHRAWKDLNHDDDDKDDDVDDSQSMSVRETLELQVLQDLMHSAIHVSSPVTFKAILVVLEPLHSDKKNKKVASLLHRLYSPILWRSLAASNPAVRRNAVVILETIFPLLDPLNLQNNNPMKTAVLKATAALQTTLNDPDPEVRVAASHTTANICAVFWDALPSQEIRALLNLILIEHSSDAASAAVRAASVEAAAILIEATQSHGVMRALLPSLGNLIHDKAEKVRLAVVRMLIRIKRIPGIRFYHVVPADQLLTRFVEEATIHRTPRNIVTKELTALMLNSYFPQGENVSGDSQLKRTISFLLTDPDAAAVFYANLADQLEIASIVKLILNLQNCIKSMVEVDQASDVKRSRKEKKRRRRRTAEKEENDTEEDNDDTEMLSASNTALLASLAETINILWASIIPQLNDPRHNPLKTDLETRFSSKEVVTLVAHFEEKGLECCSSSDNNRNEEMDSCRNECFRASSSILCCAARLDAKSLKEISSFISSSMISISKGQGNSFFVPLITSYLAFMCKSNLVGEVTASLAKCIEDSIGEDINLFSPSFDEPVGVRRSRRSNRGSDEALVPTFTAEIGWGVLENILQCIGSEGQTLREAILSSDSDRSRLDKALQKGIRFAERLLRADSVGRNVATEEVEEVIHAFDACWRFTVHKEASAASKGDCNDGHASTDHHIFSLIEWTTHHVLPVLVGSDEFGVSHLLDLDVSHISNVNDSLVHCVPGSPSVSSPPKQKANLGRTPEAMRGSVSSMFERSQHDPPIVFAFQFATTLLEYSCHILAEILAIGQGPASVVSIAAVGWTPVLQQEKVPLTQPLVGSFIRLANQICRTSHTFDLLEELIVKQIVVSNDTTSETDLHRMVTAMLKKGSKDIIDLIVKSYLNSVDRSIRCIDIPSEYRSASSSIDVPGTPSTQILLKAVVGHPPAAITLCQALVTNLSENPGDVTKRDIFMATCLSFVSRNASQSPTMARILDDFLPGRFAEGCKRALVERILVDRDLEGA